MKIVITLIFLITYLTTIAQNFTKSTESFTAKNGEIFKVGDKITIASPADFSNTFSYYYQGKNLKKKQNAIDTVTIGKTTVVYDNRSKYSIIKYFLIDPILGTFAVTDGLFNIMVNINKAIETREVVSQKHRESMVNNSIRLTDSLAYIRMINQINSIDIDNAKEFLYLFNNKKYNEIREDEFEFQDQISTTLKQLNEDALNKKTEDTLKILLTIDLENYDFDKNGFPVAWNNQDGIQVLSNIWEALTPEDINKNKVKLTDLRIKFTNTDLFDLLPLNKEKANLFVKHRKNFNGNINRTVYIWVHFLIKNSEIEQGSELKYDFLKKKVNLNSEIIKVDFFEDKVGYNWLNSIGK
jgi:hypothetical protein